MFSVFTVVSKEQSISMSFYWQNIDYSVVHSLGKETGQHKCLSKGVSNILRHVLNELYPWETPSFLTYIG